MHDTTQYKKTLEEEFKKLEKELLKLGVHSSKSPEEWNIKVPEMDIMNADENEVADRNEELHVDSIILDELAVRYANVSLALKKIEENNYGFCEICNEAIEEDRLEANPAARTCKKHIEEESA
jgi:RNA polymerase-binding transcription factor DksA